MVLEAVTRMIRELQRTVGEHLNLDRQMRLFEDAGLRSIEFVALIYRCEKEFDIDLAMKPELLQNVRTVGDAVDLIDTLRREPGRTDDGR